MIDEEVAYVDLPSHVSSIRLVNVNSRKPIKQLSISSKWIYLVDCNCFEQLKLAGNNVNTIVYCSGITEDHCVSILRQTKSFQFLGIHRLKKISVLIEELCNSRVQNLDLDCSTIGDCELQQVLMATRIDLVLLNNLSKHQLTLVENVITPIPRVFVSSNNTIKSSPGLHKLLLTKEAEVDFQRAANNTFKKRSD